MGLGSLWWLRYPASLGAGKNKVSLQALKIGLILANMKYGLLLERPERIGTPGTLVIRCFSYFSSLAHLDISLKVIIALDVAGVT